MTGPVLRARECCGRTWDDPSEETLHDLLADLNLTPRFVVVERLDRRPRGHHSMRVHLNDDLSYRVEYRGGGADRHFWAHVPRPPEMLASQPFAGILADWAAGRPGWRGALPRRPWSAEDDPDRAPGESCPLKRGG